MEWRKDSRVASHWHFNTSLNKVECELCPRHCKLPEGKFGFCQVRGNVQNELHTFNYGRSIQATEENIETEAVYHYRPGARILSMGNVGCMMACSYCQNWQTSQVKHLNPKNVAIYTPEQVVELALGNGIEIISWTYNDPVVWHEFVMATSLLARQHGIKTLYKSALYIELEPLRELIEVIDIFSISLKSMSAEVYRKVTKGELQPVLDALRLIGTSDRHLEISQLVVTDLNDDGTDARLTARWIVDNLGPHVPLHFVAYHPAYRYTKERTQLSKLLELREIALAEGIEFCYLGNVYADEVSNTFCKTCNQKQVERFGLSVRVIGLDDKGRCTCCGTPSTLIEPLAGQKESSVDFADFIPLQTYSYVWNEQVNGLHIVVAAEYTGKLRFQIKRLPAGTCEFIELNQGLERAILTKSGTQDHYIQISVDSLLPIYYLPVLDRAHFPVVEDQNNLKKYLN
jgi:pyruvate formate lyase activating enzyme